MRRILQGVAFVVWYVCWTTAALAQQLPGVDMPEWRDVAAVAEAALDEDTATDAELERLRSQIVEFREEFAEARGMNAERIRSLREQLELLGAPVDGPAADASAALDAVTGTSPPAEENPQADAAPEAPELAEKRNELEAQLTMLTAPVQVAEAAYTRADGLIGEIDTTLRNRQAEALLEVVETPVNPVLWAPAIEELRGAFDKLWRSGSEMDAEQRLIELRRNAPLILLVTLAGLILIFRGRRWATSIVQRLRRKGTRGLGIWRFLVSLLRIVLPLLGLSLLSYAALRTGYFGRRGDELLQVLPIIGGVMLGFRWVGERLFSRDDDEALLDLSQADRAQARFLVSMLTVLLIIEAVLLIVLELDDASTATKTVVSFPFTVLVGYAIYRIGRLLRHYGNETVADEDSEISRASTLGRLIRSLGTISILIGVASPLLQLAGYKNAADALLEPWAVTLVVLGLVLALQRFSADVYGAVTGRGEDAREALMPIFFGMALLLIAAPLLALVWGARVSDLTEVWAAFQRGFAIGNSRISPTDFLAFVIIFTVGYLATRLAQGALKTNVLPKTRIDKGGQNAIVSGLGYVGIFLAALAAITGAGLDLSSLAIVAGALSVGIGFGLQTIVSNFVSGIILLIERPISEGDWIEVGDQMGYVRDISVRSTRIETFDGTDVIVPNADLVSGTVTNFTRGNTLGRVIVPVGVAYGTDTKKVQKILLEIAENQPMTVANPPPAALFLSFGADALEFEIRMFLRDVNWMMAVKSDVNHEIAQRFAEEGIEIPFAQRDVWLRNPEVLHAAPQTPNSTTPDDGEADAAEGAAPAALKGEGEGEGDT
ncbi:DUF3772 domain-containing protein [Sulfitobacter sp. S190]|nr:DUF3772 domain-containing protein [Sulfitobacter sp. S190]